MWAMKVAYYRAFQKVMKIFMMFLDWSEPQLLTGPGAIKKLPGVIKDKGINNVMIVTDKGLMSLHLLDGLFKQLDKGRTPYSDESGNLFGDDPRKVFLGDPYSKNGWGCWAPVIENAVKRHAVKLRESD